MAKRGGATIKNYQVFYMDSCGLPSVLVKYPGEAPMRKAVEAEIEIRGCGETLEEAFRRAREVAGADTGVQRILAQAEAEHIKPLFH